MGGGGAPSQIKCWLGGQKIPFGSFRRVCRRPTCPDRFLLVSEGRRDPSDTSLEGRPSSFQENPFCFLTDNLKVYNLLKFIFFLFSSKNTF